MVHSRRLRKHPKKGRIAVSIALLTMLLSLLLSACGGNTQTQQQANKSKNDLDKMITHAQSIGVPTTLLQPIINQEHKLGQTNAPLTVFSDAPANDYYTNIAKRYQMLNVQVRGLEDQATQQLDYRAAQDLKAFENILAQRQSQGFVEAKTFADQFTQDQKLMAQAQYPKNYIQISNSVKDSTQALRLMGTAYDKMTSLQDLIKQMKNSNLDTTALDSQVQSDVELFRKATKADDFTQIMDQLDVQTQSTVTLSTQAIPYVGAAKLKQFSDAIDTMKKYGVDTGTYQQHLTSDKTALDNAKTLDDYLKFSTQVDNDINSTRIPMMQGQAKYLGQQFHQEVNTWGNANLYHDPTDGKDYKLDYSYDQQGIGGDLDAALQAAQTPDDYQAVIDLANSDMTNLQAMETDYKDTTSWDQPHASDKTLMQHYNVTTGQVIVVSLVEQTMRVYQDGQMVRAFQIVSGRYELPSPAGFWHVFARVSPTVFKSGEKPGDRFWYPDTPIKYAMEYHEGGYFFHDSTWRLTYGGHSNLPHHDASGDDNWGGNGSHGCINMALNDVGWLYQNTGYGTAVIMY